MGDPFDRAFLEARRAESEGEVPVGAVLVHKNGTLLAQAGNRVLALKDPTAHAEILVIRQACQSLGTERLADCDLYVTLEPCALCAAAISFARIRRLYFAASDPRGGAVEHGPCFYHQPTCHHVPEVYGGFRVRESLDLLQLFFKKRRSSLKR